MTRQLRVLVAGMGNDLRGDDGFGVEVARRLRSSAALPPRVTLVEAGIAGVRIVQELMDGYDALLLVDAVVRGGAPGTLYELVPAAAAAEPGPADAPDSLHTVEPGRVITLARAAGCLPPRVAIVGCEPADCDELVAELTPKVADAVPRAVARVVEQVCRWSSEVPG